MEDARPTIPPRENGPFPLLDLRKNKPRSDNSFDNCSYTIDEEDGSITTYSTTANRSRLRKVGDFFRGRIGEKGPWMGITDEVSGGSYQAYVHKKSERGPPIAITGNGERLKVGSIGTKSRKR